MRPCIIEGCRTGYRSVVKYNKANGIKNRSLFKAPTEEMRMKWQEAIPQQAKILGPLDVVCERHFQESDLERAYVTLLRDGTVFKLERKIPKLRLNAVPSIFSNYHHKHLRKTQEEGKPKPMEKIFIPSCKTIEISEIDPLCTHDVIIKAQPLPLPIVNLKSIPGPGVCELDAFGLIVKDFDSIQLPTSYWSKTAIRKNAQTELIFGKQNVIPLVKVSGLIEAQLCSGKRTELMRGLISERETEVETLVEKEAVDNVSTCVFLVLITPPTSSVLFPLHSCASMGPETLSDMVTYPFNLDNVTTDLAFACWAPDLLSIFKHFVLHTDMKVSVCVSNQPVSLHITEIENMKSLMEFLTYVNRLIPCLGANETTRSTKCCGYIVRPTIHRGGPVVQRCDDCRYYRHLLRRQRKVVVEERRINLQNKLRNSKRQVTKLQSKVQNLKQTVQELMERCSRQQACLWQQEPTKSHAQSKP